MSDAVAEIVVNRATAEQIATHLRACDADFAPALSRRVDLAVYARKLAAQATRLEAWSGETLVALAAIYCNDRQTYHAHLSSLSVLADWRGHGLARQLLERGLALAREAGMETMSLQVGQANAPAIALYRQTGFRPNNLHGDFIAMTLQLSQST
jgi:GNAT superfamily N-acetyltransferase